VLGHNKYEEGLNPSRSLLESLLPQLSHAIPSVNSAAAALGAVYECRVLSNSVGRSQFAVELQYSFALRALQRDVESQPHGSVPLLLACILLSSAELLQRHYSNAMMHLRGAFEILLNRPKIIPRAAASNVSSENHFPFSSEHHGKVLPKDGVALLFQALDTHRPAYVLGRPPYLPTCLPDIVHWRPPESRDLKDLSMQLVQIIHSCYHFIGKAAEYKYLPRNSLPPEILVEQGRCIATLSLWLQTLDRNVLSARADALHKSSFGTCRHVMMLRAQCFIMIICTSTITSPLQTTFDVYASQFQQIVENSAEALGNEREYLTGVGQFSGGPGVTQPLFFTALWYRHAAWRRKAIKLLREAGREGPWDGQLLAAVATRAVEIEETALASTSLDEIVPICLVEGDRLHGCVMDVEARDGRPTNVVRVTYSLCHNMEEMLSAKAPWQDKRNWSTWDEDISF
jgi:hypothetical protein